MSSDEIRYSIDNQEKYLKSLKKNMRIYLKMYLKELKTYLKMVM